MSQPNGTAAAQNILSLNDSTSPLVEQIETACKILDIELEGSSEGPEIARKRPGSQGPREEWALRWLLKKLETAESNSPSVLLELKVWLLFGELIPRLPLTNLARLLRDHGFLNIIQNTLKSLADAMGRDGNSVHEALQSPTTRSNGSSSEAGSSSATIDADETERRSKKRNRDGTYKERSSVTSALDLRPAFCRLCGVLRQLQAFVQDESHGYAVEHLKMALRAPTEQAANIFGRFLTVAYSLFLKDPTARAYEQSIPLKESIESSIHIWKSRSVSTNRSSTNLLFADECFLPMLEVLTALDDLEMPTGELNGAKDILEGLLLQHVVIPLRENFENSRNPRVARDDETVGNSADELLDPLQRLALMVDLEQKHDSSTLRPIAHLYSIVVKYTPLDTSKQRVSEKGWLQFLFDRLTTHASILVVPSPAGIKALKEIFKTLLAKKMKLDIATLERILSSVSHLLGDQQSLVNWDIISLCLKMDPDVFVVPTVSRETVSGEPVRIPNRFLRALYDKSYLFSGSLRSTSPDIHQSVLEDSFIPLIDGFIHARDLSGFIKQWITNLEHSRSHLLGTDHIITGPGRRQAGSDIASEAGSLIDNAQTLWEHETLLEAVASHIETRLTTGQIDRILQNAKTVLLDVKYSANKEKGQSFLANLVIVDSQSDRKPEVCSIEEKAAWRALELASYMGKFHPVEVDDVLQSCNFGLSVINNVTSPNRGEYANHLMKSIIHATRLYGESVCAKSHEAEHIGSHQVEILRHCVPLIIRDLCSRPAVLLTMISDEQTVFFKQLFKCSVLIAQGRLETSVDMWQTLSTAKFLEDSRSLATTFRAFQLDALLGNITYDQDNLNIDTRTIEGQAIESIHRTPLHAFDGKQRSRIFNHIAERLVDAQSLTPRSTVDSLKLLINSLTEPRRSMMLLVEPSGSIPPWQEISDDETAAVPTLFRIAFALDEQSDSSSADPESLVLFKCFAQQVLE
ncbi:MAG: hypothetical protein LQ350_006290 [Teloschistes chrysophthalmus]|nr:MAG: hypothetical protein LQ350_006290 [Niorma chrysophthalma]